MGGWARGDDCDCDCNILPTIQQAGLPSCRHNGCGRGMHACILMIGAASIDASETHQHHEERNNLGGLRTDRQCWSPPARAPPTSNIMIVAPDSSPILPRVVLGYAAQRRTAPRHHDRGTNQSQKLPHLPVVMKHHMQPGPDDGSIIIEYTNMPKLATDNRDHDKKLPSPKNENDHDDNQR
eukprot:CAMPEP_0119547502 /NCGR_PEP_ID=MMETSP1352-20130426/1618_1 /TAXON_ID=265584 /ORGANISM="Stauroneis constricta, Strain CCMP1120" /LENGTH=180 /DNA_ID=CAMNT_0007592449 /DNA_START=114 /DNA_END=653 /DNA_ORIENTATION=-